MKHFTGSANFNDTINLLQLFEENGILIVF